ncbi:helix-turn-helix domain-containing protein, partial [Dysgonomonas mossii]|uniref:helix-turn-helix domain-containing protein n=1 Tax=Dysgonomonas mossii TaxID=163665 RepID=UPI00399157A3
YLNILNYFAEKKPFCDPDYTIVQLAKYLNSNVKYISKIIKIKKDVNFSAFLNKYRIKLIKELIAKDYHNKYTIRHIYASAGFRHQSTFNKVFKELEGITPSEYIKSNKGKNLD